MKAFVEKIKDILYDNTDYLIILLIIVIVAGIVSWRFNSLFNDDKDLVDSSITTQSVKDIDDTKTEPQPSDDLIEEEKQKQKGTISVNIPEGSLPDVIANILLDHKVITDKFEFLKKSQEMGLDTELKSGDYKFMRDESVEDVIRKVSKQ